MAKSNKWQENKALCPFCLTAFGTWTGKELETPVLNLLRVATLRCGNDQCRRVFTFRPLAATVRDSSLDKTYILLDKSILV